MADYVRYCMIFSFFAVIGMGGCREAAKNDSAPVGPDRTVVLDYIVEYYSPDGSQYVSEQIHKINFDDKILRISANEPTGKFEWLLKNGVFTVPQNPAQTATPSMTLCDENIAKGLLALYIANADNMGLSLAEMGEPVKIEGRLYQKLAGSGGLTLCRNLDTSIIDMVLSGGTGKKNLMLRGYEYRKPETAAGAVPAKIEIFKTGAGGQDMKPLVRYNGVLRE